MGMKTPEISQGPAITIGMPVYNGAAFLREALDSVLAQTFDDFELLISDNASTDETGDICREYASRDKRIRYIRQPENAGAVANFKYVTREARGTFFTWVAHDDRIKPEFLETALTYMKAHPRVVIAVTDFFIIDEEGKKISQIEIECLRDSIPWEERVFKFFCFPVSTCNAFMSIYGLMRTDVCKQIMKNTSDRSEASGGEHPILCRFAATGEIASLPLILRDYRRHPDNISTTEKIRTRKNSWFARTYARLKNWSYIAGQMLLVLLSSRLPVRIKAAAALRIILGYVKFVISKLFRIKRKRSVPWNLD